VPTAEYILRKTEAVPLSSCEMCVAREGSVSDLSRRRIVPLEGMRSLILAPSHYFRTGVGVLLTQRNSLHGWK
jgi:hypothetical protein